MLGNDGNSNLEQGGDGLHPEENTGPRSRFRSAAGLREEDSDEDSGSELDTTNDEDGEGEGEGEKDEGLVARRLDGELEAAGLGLPSTLARQESTGGDDDLDAVAVQAPAAASMLGFSGFESVATFRVFLAALADNGVNLENVGLTTDEDTGRAIITIFAGAESNDELTQKIGKLLKQAKKDSEFNSRFQQLQVLEGDLPEDVAGVGVDVLATPRARSVEEFIAAAFADGEGGSGEEEGEGGGADDEERVPALEATEATSTKKIEDDGSEDESSCASAVAACRTRTVNAAVRAREAVEAAGAAVWWLGEEAVGGVAARLGDAGAVLRSLLPATAVKRSEEEGEDGGGEAVTEEGSAAASSESDRLPSEENLIKDFKNSEKFRGFLTALERLGVSAENVEVIFNETNGRLDIEIDTPAGITLDSDTVGVMIHTAAFGREFNEVHIHPAVASDAAAEGREGDVVDEVIEEVGRIDDAEGREGNGDEDVHEEGGAQPENEEAGAIPSPTPTPAPATSPTPAPVAFEAWVAEQNETHHGDPDTFEAVPIIGAFGFGGSY